MKKIFLITLLLLPVIAFSQKPDEVVGRFKGLATVKTPMNMTPDEAVNCHNIDLSHGGLGTLTSRFGSYVVSTKHGCDSLLTIAGVYRKDRNRYLAFAQSDSAVKYGSLWAGQLNSHYLDSSTKIWSYWGDQQPTSICQLREQVFFANGCQRMIVYSDDYARPYPQYAPGEPTLSPSSELGNLNGEYSYMITMWRTIGSTPLTNDSSAGVPGYFSNKVRVTNGKVIITGFAYPPSPLGSTPEHVTFRIWRTLSSVGAIRPTTPFYRVHDVTFDYPSHNDDTITLSSSYTDNTSDSSLLATGTHIHFREMPQSSYARGTVQWGNRYGSVIKYRGVMAVGYQPSGVGVGFERVPFDPSVYYWAIVCTIEDTLLMKESDTCAVTFIEPYGDTTVGGVKNPYVYDTIIWKAPNVPKYVSNCRIKMYRAPVLLNPLTVWFGSQKDPNRSKEKAANSGKRFIIPYFAYIGSCAPGDTLVDTVSYSNLPKQILLDVEKQPSNLSNIFVHDGKLLGYDGDNLYISRNDTAQFSQARFVSLNPADGDMITAGWSSRGLVRIGKTRSMFNAYQDAEGNWSKFEVSSGVGCIAPQSHVRTSAGDYFLSQRGIELENEGGQLERFYSSKPVSLMLNNFTKLPIEHKRRAVGAWIPRENKVLWSISTPTWDTTYVFDELVGGWVTWSLKYRAWTLYDTTTGTSDGPGDAFYFVPPGSSKLCRYHTKDITSSTFGDAIIDYEPTTSGLGREPVGSSAALSDTTANAQIVSIYYKSGALLANTYQLTQINRIGMWAMNAVTDPVTGYRNRISFRLLNDKGTVANSGSWMTLDSLSLRYRWKDIIGYPSRYYQIEIAPVTAGTFGNTTIEHIDIWASRKERWR